MSKKAMGRALIVLGAVTVIAGFVPSFSSTVLGFIHANNADLNAVAIAAPIIAVVATISAFASHDPKPAIAAAIWGAVMFSTWIAPHFMMPNEFLGETLSGRLLLATGSPLDMHAVNGANFGFIMAGLVLGGIMVCCGAEMGSEPRYNRYG